MLKKQLSQVLLILSLIFAAHSGRSAILVSTGWSNSVRTCPTYNNNNSPYSEMGMNYNGSDDFGSAWFASTGSTPIFPAAGNLRAVQAFRSLTSTHFTPKGGEINLASLGDPLEITWGFTTTTVNHPGSH